jgi:5-methylcytosine-specific restriction endonuclease McrA
LAFASIDAQRAWHAENRERLNAQRRHRYATDAAYREYRKAKAAELDQRDGSRLAQWVADHPEEHAAAQRRYKAEHPEQVLADARVRRARQAGAPRVERIYRAVVWQRDEGVCHLCSTAADPIDWHLDHVVPLARGGSHTYDNVAVAHPLCNMRKGAR